MNSANARQRADDLKARLRNRLAELDAQRQLSSSPPVVAGGALVVPVGLLARLHGSVRQEATSHDAAMTAVLRIEAGLGRTPRRAGPEEQGYDVESRAVDGSPLFITVRHRTSGTNPFLITRSELGVARNTGARHVLALVDGDQVRYLRQALDGIANPAFGTAAIPLPWQAYFERGQVPQ
jgi:hypothetical protein